jgi:hypothetical protein
MGGELRAVQEKIDNGYYLDVFFCLVQFFYKLDEFAVVLISDFYIAFLTI